jgi:methionyl-tRNA formyltransferase
VISAPGLVFIGSPAFSVPVLNALVRDYRVVGVVTQPDRPAGRGRGLSAPPVKRAAQALSLPLIQPEKIRASEAMAELRAWEPDLIIVASFGQILRPELLELPRYGCLNVHASLLPRWRGAAPVQAALLAGDTQTGITIMKMDAGVDTGPLLRQRSLPITVEDTTGTLLEKLAGLGGDLLLETLPDYLSGKTLPRPQPGEGVTYAPPLRKEDGRLDFTRPSAELARCVRAFQPWPGAWMPWRNGVLKILRVSTHAAQVPPGQRIVDQGFPAVGTEDGLLIFKEVQPAGRKAMSGKAFLAGVRDWASAA